MKNRIAISCFATNVARLDSIAAAAAANDRHVALVGRSLWRINEAARANGYLKDAAPFLSEHDAGFLPREKTVLICTGSQGEPRSALSRIAADDHPEIVLERGDAVIFSSREIPGNERAIGRVQNLLIGQGVEVITADDAFVHVSGHPAQDELIQMYQWVRPKLCCPDSWRDSTSDGACPPRTVLSGSGHHHPGKRFDHQAGSRARRGRGQVQHGRLALDGKRIVPLDAGVMRGRHRMMYNGAAVATLVMDAAGALVTQPQVTVMGLIEGPEAGRDSGRSRFCGA